MYWYRESYDPAVGLVVFIGGFIVRFTIWYGHGALGQKQYYKSVEVALSIRSMNARQIEIYNILIMYKKWTSD